MLLLIGWKLIDEKLLIYTFGIDMKDKKKLIFSALISSGLLLSCAGENKQQQNETDKELEENIKQEEKREDKVERIKQIFHTLPSPLELISLFKKEGAQYRPEILHNTSERKNYELTFKKALNLGVYGADLSYAGLFGRHEDAIEFFAVSQILADDLGIGSTFQHQFISRLEENAGNKDTLLRVVGDFFVKNDAYLKQDGQQDISTLVLIGGWVEGMFLGTNIVNGGVNTEGVRNIIINQKESLHNIIVLLLSVEPSDDINRLIDQVGELETYYRRIEGNMTEEDFENIRTKVSQLRKDFINR